MHIHQIVQSHNHEQAKIIYEDETLKKRKHVPHEKKNQNRIGSH